MSNKPVSESYRAERKKTFKTGSVAIGNGEVRHFCILKNVSQTGALIQTPNAHEIPEGAVLVVNLNGMDVECKVMRRDGTNLGVKFLGNPCLKVTSYKEPVDVTVQVMMDSLVGNGEVARLL